METFELEFQAVFEKLSSIDFAGESGPPFPFEVPPTTATVAAAMEQGANHMPYLFRTSYAEPLQRALGALMQQATENRSLLETLTGALYQHAQPELAVPLRRLLAVISDLFRSFLSSKRRATVDVPLVEQYPPLAAFQRDGSAGPFTYTCSDVQRFTGAPVGVVSLPAIFRSHPLLWATLAHETGGHDVIHADPLLLPELEHAAKVLFNGDSRISGGTLNENQALALIWSYWMEEAAADVYAVLNMGPVFGLNMAAYFSALNAKQDKSDKPVLRASSGFIDSDVTHALDSHPTDLLRLSLIDGAVANLRSLSPDTRRAWRAKLDEVARICGRNASSIHVAGVIADGPGRHIPIEVSLSLSTMCESARKVGALVVNSKLKSLGGKTIQDIETWDDDDEAKAHEIALRLSRGASLAGTGDDAQILAGANIALFEAPSQYEAITGRLEEALDISFAQDPYWGKLEPDFIANFSTNSSLKGTGLTPLTVVRQG